MPSCPAIRLRNWTILHVVAFFARKRFQINFNNRQIFLYKILNDWYHETLRRTGLHITNICVSLIYYLLVWRPRELVLKFFFFIYLRRNSVLIIMLFNEGGGDITQYFTLCIRLYFCDIFSTYCRITPRYSTTVDIGIGIPRYWKRGGTSAFLSVYGAYIDLSKIDFNSPFGWPFSIS